VKAVGLTAVVALLLLGACSSSAYPDKVASIDPQSLSACQQSFDPERVKAGENCAPVAQQYCPVGPRLSVLQSSAIPCDGVSIDDYTISAAGLDSHYLAIHRSGQTQFDAVVVALHFLNASVGTFANVARLPELAKARGVLVLVPQAPGGNNSRWPTSPALEPIDQYVSFLSGVVADARSHYRTTGASLYALGLSNGATMAYFYGCRSSDAVRSLLAVSGDLSPDALNSCQPAGPIGTVIVHGTGDSVSPYEGVPLVKAPIPDIHAHFKMVNGCIGDDAQVDLPRVYDELAVAIDYTAPCNQGRRDYLVTITGGGHVWPGGDATAGPLDLSSLALYGFRTLNFDATLQGYDLLRLAGQ